MPETVIELDVSTPWVPPEPAAPRFRLRARWVAVAVVLAVSLGLLAAAGPRSGAGLLYTLDQQVLQAQIDGERIYLARYSGTTPGPMIEARRLSDGAPLWQRPAEVYQQLLVGGPDVVLLISQDQHGRGDSSALVALDPATGKELWTRSELQFRGTTPGAVLVEDVRGQAPDVVLDGYPADLDLTMNYAGPQPERHLVGLAARTGATAWQVTVPAGSDVNFSWSSTFRARVNRFDVLSRTGELTRWDTRTGAVTETHQLDWSGAAAMFNAGWLDGSGQASDRVVVLPDRQRGAIVYDLRTGRQLFRVPGESGKNMFRCTPDLFCSRAEGGIDAVDSTTGALRWHVDGRDVGVGFAGNRLLVGSYADFDSAELAPASIVDSRTGAVVKQLTGWRVLIDGGRPLLWRPVDKRTAVIGELDPVTGLIDVFAHAEDWYGNPECTVTGGILACVVVGGLSVWRLPNGR